MPSSYKTCGLCILLLLLGCSGEKRPKDVLPPSKMISVLKDIYITEEITARTGVSRDSLQEIFEYFNKDIKARYNLDDSTVRKSMDYYMKRPEELSKIYAAILDTLNLMDQRSIRAQEERSK